MADNRLKAVATARAYDQGNIANLDDAMTRRLIASTVLTESYGGDLGPINRLGYVGRYQAGAAWLVDAGYIDLEKYREARNSMTAREWESGGGQLRFMRDSRNWNDGLSLDRYLASDDLQDRAFRINCNRSYNQALRNGLLDENATPETVAGFLKARHLSGYDGARNVVQGGRVIRDENGTSNYDYFHDITRNRDGLNELMSRDVQQQPPRTQTPATPEPQAQQTRAVRSFDDVMRVMLPPQNGVNPHMTSDYGHRTLNGRADHHGGVDFNYVGGQNGINLRHPTVHSPVSGVVIYGAGQGSYGTVKIRDDQGNVHEILHLDSRSVRATNPPTRIEAGDPIGTMGGRGPSGAGQYAQHVHYQVRDPSGRTVDPETFWRGRQIEVPGGARTGDTRTPPTDRNAAIADGVLRRGERGDDVLGLQQNLNRLGIRDARGNPLVEDGRYGDRTFEAIEAYQRANGLKVDGIAGPRTLESIGNRLPPGTVTVQADTNPQQPTGFLPDRTAQQLALRADDPSHPNHATYQRIHSWIQGTGNWNAEQSSNIAAALYREQALNPDVRQVDRVTGGLGRDGAQNVFAVYAPYGDREPTFHVRVDGRSAAQVPAAQSLDEAERISREQPDQPLARQQTQTVGRTA